MERRNSLYSLSYLALKSDNSWWNLLLNQRWGQIRLNIIVFSQSNPADLFTVGNTRLLKFYVNTWIFCDITIIHNEVKAGVSFMRHHTNEGIFVWNYSWIFCIKSDFNSLIPRLAQICQSILELFTTHKTMSHRRWRSTWLCFKGRWRTLVFITKTFQIRSALGTLSRWGSVEGFLLLHSGWLSLVCFIHGNIFYRKIWRTRCLNLLTYTYFCRPDKLLTQRGLRSSKFTIILSIWAVNRDIVKAIEAFSQSIVYALVL